MRWGCPLNRSDCLPMMKQKHRTRYPTIGREELYRFIFHGWSWNRNSLYFMRNETEEIITFLSYLFTFTFSLNLRGVWCVFTLPMLTHTMCGYDRVISAWVHSWRQSQRKGTSIYWDTFYISWKNCDSKLPHRIGSSAWNASGHPRCRMLTHFAQED